MAEMSPGDKLINGRKLGHFKMPKVLFLLISAVVCIIIFYANTNSIIFGRRSLLAIFLSNRSDTLLTSAPLTSFTQNGQSSLVTFIENADNHNDDSNIIQWQQQQMYRKRDHSLIDTVAKTEIEMVTIKAIAAPKTTTTTTSYPTISSKSKPKTKSITSTKESKPLIVRSHLLRPPSSKYDTWQTVLNITAIPHISDYHIFVIYTKENYQLHVKFELFARSLLKHLTSGILLHLHLLTDEISAHSLDQILEMEVRRYRRSLIYSIYNMRLCAERVSDIVNAMTPYFSSTPKSYYSDALFFISLGLHRIADKSMKRAILLDCDIVFRADVRLLFKEFDEFSHQNLFGLAPELTPVYRHILYRYRANYPNTDFGNPFYPLNINSNTIYKGTEFDIGKHQRHGYPGLNSGVVMLQLKRIRQNRLYHNQLQEIAIRKLTTKYMFKGHLGDQDFFTLLGYEYPNLIYRLDCIWNRQLCTWWKDHGYSDVFDQYFTCKGHIRMYHGNCNARIPE